jgi:hypothetical protein
MGGARMLYDEIRRGIGAIFDRHIDVFGPYQTKIAHIILKEELGLN